MATAARRHGGRQGAPPVMRRSAAPPSRYAPPPVASLSAVPAVQRACAACDEKGRRHPIQPRLEVGPVGDRYEQEADSIAARVMAMPDPASATQGAATRAEGLVQRACACSSARDELRARRAAGPDSLAASDTELTRGGAPLPAATRDFFEGRMGRDLSGVRVHQGSSASAMNASIAARAFTYKNHVWLGASETAGPSFTMAHELAHVMQQTAPGPVGPQRRSASDTGAEAAAPSVRRKENVFWLPGTTINAKGLHTTMHDTALRDIRKVNSNVLTEVPIPGANRKLIDLGARGRADIYTASGNGTKIMVPGVQEVARPATSAPTSAPASTPGAAGQPAGPASVAAVVPAASIADLDNFTASALAPMEQGGGPIDHERHRAPKIDSTPQLIDMSFAPQEIRIGEMKPAHDLDYRKSGAKQVANYISGISSVANKVNQVAAVARGNLLWRPDPKAIGSALKIPTGWDAKQPHSDWPQKNLKIRHYEASKPKAGGKKVKAKTSQQGRPKSQPIRGRWMMAPDNLPGHEGVFVYFLAPNPTDLSNALKPRSTRAGFRALAGKVHKIQKDLITAPKASAAGAKPQPLLLAQPLPAASAAPSRVARKDAKEVKDPFKAVDWEKERTGAGGTDAEKSASLLGSYADAADSDMRTDIAEQGAMVEWLKTKPPTPGEKYDDPAQHSQVADDLSLLKSVDFWTSLKAKPFGILREKFGLFFVKAYEKTVAFGKLVKEKFKGVTEGKLLGGKTGTILKAAAKVAAVVLPRLVKPFLSKMLDTIIDCAITGFEAKFRELIQGTIIDDIIQTAEELKEKVENIAADVEQYFKDMVNKALGPIAAEFEEFIGTAKLALDVAKMIKDITEAIRIGSCVAGLISAPETVGIGAVVGCGAALGDFILSKFGLSPVDYLVASLLSSCDMQNKIGTLMAGLSYVKTLPQRAGMGIVRMAKTFLADNKTLQELGSFGGKTYAQHASELFCDPDGMKFPEMGYEPTDCSDTGDYPRSKTGDYEIPDSIPRYTPKNPIPPEELPWKGVEVPKGREGQQVQPPAKPQTPPTPAANPTDQPDPPKAPAADDATKGSSATGGDKATSAAPPQLPVITTKITGLDPKGKPVGIFFIVHPPVAQGGWSVGNHNMTLDCRITMKTTDATYGPSDPVSVTISKILPANPPGSERHAIEFTLNQAVRLTSTTTGHWIEAGKGLRTEYTQVGVPQ